MQRHLDQFDLEAEREASAIRTFSRKIGESAGRVGTPKQKARKRSFDRLTQAQLGDRLLRLDADGRSEAHYQGAKTGLWRGIG